MTLKEYSQYKHEPNWKLINMNKTKKRKPHRRISVKTAASLLFRLSYYEIATPALAYPATVVPAARPVVVTEKTINKRVSVVTGIANPDVTPWDIVPIATTPERDGANVTIAPGIGVNMLFGVVDCHNWACTVAVAPIRLRAAVVLK